MIYATLAAEDHRQQHYLCQLGGEQSSIARGAHSLVPQQAEGLLSQLHTHYPTTVRQQQ